MPLGIRLMAACAAQKALCWLRKSASVCSVGFGDGVQGDVVVPVTLLHCVAPDI
jgi:hypothetical protein